MEKISEKISMLILSSLLLSACGDDGGDDSDSNREVSNGETPEIAVSDKPVINLSGVVTLVEYDEIVEQEGAVGAASVRAQSSNLQYSNSNWLGIDENGDTIFPLANIRDLKVNWTQLSPDHTKLYISVTSDRDEDWDYRNKASAIGLKNNYVYEEEYRTWETLMPLIGPLLSDELDFPLTSDEFSELYPDGRIYLMSRGNSACENGIETVWNSCVNYLEYTFDDDDYVTIEFAPIYNRIVDIIADDYMYCPVIELDRITGDIDCLGGTEEVSHRVSIFGYDFDIPVRRSRLVENEINLFAYENIRRGLKPLQFDDEGNIYLAGSLYHEGDDYWDTEGQNILRITVDGEIEELRSFDSYRINDAYIALGNGDVVTRMDGSNDGGLFMLQDGSLLNISGGWNGFTADTGSTLIVGGNLVVSLPGGGFSQVPLSWNSTDSNVQVSEWGVFEDYYVTDEGKVYGCRYLEVRQENGNYQRGQYIVQVLPYAPFSEFAIEDCNFGTMSQGHRVEARTVSIGNLGTTQVLDITRLTDNATYTIFEAEDYASVARYSITSIAYGSNTVIFSADRTSAPVGTVIGEIDIQKLSQGLPESEYLSLRDVGSSIAASNSVRNIAPLPIIEPGTTAAAPKITDVFFNESVYSHVGFEFSEFMNKESVMAAMTFTDQDSMDVTYIPFWGYKNLYLIPDLNGLGDANDDGVIGSDDYMPFQAGQTYNVSFDTNAAMDVAGRLMATNPKPNAVHSFNFPAE